MQIEQIDVYVLKLDHHYRLRGVAETPGLLPDSDYFFEPHWRQVYSRKLEACLVKQGFRAFKLFLGHGVVRDIEVLRAVRVAVGADVSLMCDLLWRYDAGDALRVGRVLDDEGYGWLEAPIAAEDIAGHTRLARSLDTPIAVGETLRSGYEFQNWLQAGALGVAQPDSMRTGITGALKVAALCEANHKPVAPHVGVSTGVGIATTWQLAAAIPGLLVQEYQHDLMAGATAILDGSFEVDDGELLVPSGAGLGIHVNEQAVREASTEHWQVRR